MRNVRVGVLRAFIACVGSALLVLPVGIESGAGPRPASVGEALAELAGGSLGVGILSAVVAGGPLFGAAMLRLALAAGAALAFVMAGWLRPRAEATTAPHRRRRCPACDAWMSRDMAECPACGTPVYT